MKNRIPLGDGEPNVFAGILNHKFRPVHFCGGNFCRLMSLDDTEQDSKPGRRKKQSEDFTKTFIEHVGEYFFDPAFVTPQEIERWLRSNPVFFEMWKTRKITSLNVYVGKKKAHKESERKYRKEIYKFLSEMSDLDPSNRVRNTLRNKAETSHFIQKYINHSNTETQCLPDVDVDSISDRISDDAKDSDEISKLIATHYNRKKYSRLKSKLIERSATDDSLLPLIQLMDDPRSVVLFLFETKFGNLLS